MIASIGIWKAASASAPTGIITASPNFPYIGQEVRTIYLDVTTANGWGSGGCAQNITFTATPSGGTPGYTYQWYKSDVNGSTMTAIPGATSNSYVWSPTSADVSVNWNGVTPGTSSIENVYRFECLISDFAGFSVTPFLRGNVIDAKNYVGGVWDGTNWWIDHKASVRGGTTHQMTAISAATAATHLAHGDYIGDIPVFVG